MIVLIAGATLGMASWLHCIGMCGPLVTVMVPRGDGGMGMLMRTILYHAGRTLMYCILGVLLGSVTDGARIVVVGSTVSLLTGSVMIALGFVQFIGTRAHLPEQITRKVHRLTMIIREWSTSLSPSLRAAVHGMINGLLPCGVSMSAIIAAATLSSGMDRILFLVAFGIVTSPALAGLALLINRINSRWQGHLRTVSAVAVVVIGVLVTMRGMSLDIPYVSPNTAGSVHVHNGCCQGGQR